MMVTYFLHACRCSVANEYCEHCHALQGNPSPDSTCSRSGDSSTLTFVSQADTVTSGGHAVGKQSVSARMRRRSPRCRGAICRAGESTRRGKQQLVELFFRPAPLSPPPGDNGGAKVSSRRPIKHWKQEAVAKCVCGRVSSFRPRRLCAPESRKT